MSVSNNPTLKRVEEALRRVVSVRGLDDRVVVNVPVMYPSGASATIEIVRNAELGIVRDAELDFVRNAELGGDYFWVSDLGYGQAEAMMSGAEIPFAGIASKVAAEFGISFDGNTVFALRVASSRLESAIVCVANASNKACSEAIQKANEARYQQKNEEIYDRIRGVFGGRRVTRSIEIAGKHASWRAHNVVVLERRRAVFEHMTQHNASISSKFIMFTDLKDTFRDEISLNAVVDDIGVLGSKGGMIADLANIIPITATDQQITRYAEAS